jgi:N-acetylglucosaminyldiphosphoundecaprenol N-acetyl-beta-D-mannosaminyltransferase
VVTIDAFSRVELDGTGFDRVTEDEVVAVVRAALDRGTGGRIITPNIDILRQARHDQRVRDYLAEADLVVADGMPLVWASRLQGTPLPERVTGAGLLPRVCEAAGDRSIFLLGGAPGVAERAAEQLRRQYPRITVAGWSPPFGMESTAKGRQDILARLRAAGSDVVFCGFGFPKQERLIKALRCELPGAWFIGCGAAITFASGRVPRAPESMQRLGMEWLHRLVMEPRRLARRYLRDDLPFAARLLLLSAARRLRAPSSNRAKV